MDAKSTFLSEFFPQSYSYCDLNFNFKSETDFEAEFHASINDLTESDTWVREFESMTKTNWKVRATYPQYTTSQRKDYVCHHQNFRGFASKGKKSGDRLKFTGCKAKLTIKVTPVNKYSRCRYKWIKDGMPATVKIKSQHNHPIMNAHVLSFRRIDNDVKEKFMRYFSQGLSVAAAIEHHVNQIDLDPEIEDPVIARADAAMNPSQRMVSYLYHLWRNSDLSVNYGVNTTSTISTNLPKSDMSNCSASVSLDPDLATHKFSVMDIKKTWRKLSDHVESLLDKQAEGTIELMSGIQMMQERLNKVHTVTQLRSFFHSSALALPRRHHSHAAIRAQPTASARRGRPLVTHGSKRQLSGRPAGGEKKVVKRPRNPAANILKNLPNRKSHGLGH